MRDDHQRFLDKDADVVAIGMGMPAMAADFRDKQDIPFLLLVDHDRRTYKMLELKRGSIWEVSGPQVWLRGMKSIATGHGVALPKQDPYQLGGAAVVGPGGEVRYIHRSSDSSDNLPVDELLSHL